MGGTCIFFKILFRILKVQGFRLESQIFISILLQCQVQSDTPCLHWDLLGLLTENTCQKMCFAACFPSSADFNIYSVRLGLPPYSTLDSTWTSTIHSSFEGFKGLQEVQYNSFDCNILLHMVRILNVCSFIHSLHLGVNYYFVSSVYLQRNWEYYPPGCQWDLCVLWTS